MNVEDTTKSSTADKEEVAKAAKQLIEHKMPDNIADAALHYNSAISSLITLYQAGKLVSLAPILPLLLSLKGYPYSLHDHYPMEPLFSIQMPRSFVFKCGRQVSKSTTLAAQGCIQSAVIPYFSSLYIAPRFEQTRKFSNNYVKPFLTNTPLGNAALAADGEQSVLQRTFKNGSTLHFSYAFLDADRVRGISADQVRYDECASKNVDILLAKGYTKIIDCKPGDSIISFTEDSGKVVNDTVVAVVPKGRRKLWRITLDSGAEIECTDNERLFTNKGWIYLEEVLDAKIKRYEFTGESTPDGKAGTASIRDLARGRLHAVQPKQVRTVPNDTRTPARNVLSTQGRATEKLHNITATNCREQGMGETELRFLDSNIASLRIYTSSLLPARLLQTRKDAQQKTYKVLQEDRNQGMAQPVNVGRTGLLVYGRRDTGERTQHCVQYPQFHRAGNRSDCRRSNSTGNPGKEAPCHKTESQLLHGKSLQGIESSVHQDDETLRPSEHGLQVRDNSAHSADDLRNMQHNVPAAPAGSADMRSEKLPSDITPGGYEEVRQHTPRRAQPKKSGTLADKPNSKQTTCSSTSAGTQTGSGVSQQDQQVQANLSGSKKTGKPEASRDGDLHILQQTDSTRPSQKRCCNSSVCGSGVQETEAPHQLPEVRSTQEMFGDLIGSGIASIEYMGIDDVFDIETTHHHTLFAGGIAVHNCQDLDTDFIPIINETLSASEYNLRQYAGTPKTLDNTLQGLWDLSSQAEWIIPCKACAHWNISSVEFDLLLMIQQHGLSCAECGKLINSELGHWEHKYADKRVTFAGYHVPQPIMPMHFRPDKQTGRMDKWELVFDAKNNMDKAKFLNEKLGESCDVRASLLTKTDVQNASILPHNNELRAALAIRGKYLGITMGVDWGGGGRDGVSHTAIALLGHRPDGKSDVIYGERLTNAGDHTDEAAIILHYFRAFNCKLLSHDFCGSGAVRETLLLQAGLPMAQIFPAAYVRASAANMVTYKPPTGASTRYYYAVDKARSLILICQMIKHGFIRFPRFETWEDLSTDFMALVEDKHEMPRGPDAYLVTKKANRSDDFAHAVNYAAVAWWHFNQRYPDLASQVGIRLTQDQIADLTPSTPELA